MNFADRLDAAIRRCGNPCVVGIDPHLHLLPGPFAAANDPSRPRAERAGHVADFCRELIDVVAERVPAVKPQSAFFERLGADGVLAWEQVVDYARERGLLVIGDLKRGDIGSTAAAYAAGLLGDQPGGCDAITVNPYLGTDSIEPFLEVCEERSAGLFVLVRTSNPGSAEFQLGGDPPLCERVAAAVVRWGEAFVGECGLSSIGAVVGATKSEELGHFRALLPRVPLLLPGYGAQGARGADLAPAFLEAGRGAVVNASRSIAFAWKNAPGAGAASDWRAASTAALDEMIADLRSAL